MLVSYNVVLLFGKGELRKVFTRAVSPGRDGAGDGRTATTPASAGLRQGDSASPHLARLHPRAGESQGRGGGSGLRRVILPIAMIRHREGVGEGQRTLLDRNLSKQRRLRERP